ncbi:MAG: hypothetical protein JWO33_1347 [Caulobacteraceae bacterium]|nr:hypothetical protein [Caulobacteraceae bacterium]
MKLFALVLFLAAAINAPAALADEIIVTRPADPPAAETPAAPPIPDSELARRQANGDWARQVMAGDTAEDARDEPRRGCQRNPDRAPHGEVWAGVGTGGYNTVGAVVTQPIGDCAEATIAVSRTEGGRVSRGRRR